MKTGYLKRVAGIFPNSERPHVFEVCESIMSFAKDQFLSAMEFAADAEFRVVPSSARLPGNAVILAFPMVDDACIALRQKGDDVLVTSCNGEDVLCLGSYNPKSQLYSVHPNFQSDPELCLEVVIAAFVVALINEPRVVSAKPSAKKRMAAQRGMALAVGAWSRVSWDLSKETVAKVSSDPAFHKMPLHWCRGHYRRAEKHYAGAVQRPDAFRPEDRALWWQWIDGVWKGHPAFGVKRSVHAPVMSAGKLASRGMAA